MLLVLEAAEVLKIAFFPDKLLASTKCLKIDLRICFWKCGETVKYDTCRETEDVR